MKNKESKRKKKKLDNLGDNEKEQLRKYKKKSKKIMCDNLFDEKKGTFKKRGPQKRKAKKSMIT